MVKTIITNNPSVTIAIPTLNGMSWLKSSIQRMKSQQYCGDIQILAMDSGSTDGTVQFLQSQGVEVHDLISHPFNHGRTRNDLVQITKSDLILLTVQDACPRDEFWIRDMVKALTQSSVDAICGGQCVPKETYTNPLQWYIPTQISHKTTVYDHTKYTKSDARARSLMCRWDNVNALYKTQILRKLPFPTIDFGEDLAWAQAALQGDIQLGYYDNGKVYHYHHENPIFVRNRTICSAYLKWRYLKVIPDFEPTPGIRWIFRQIFTLIFRRNIYWPTLILKWLNHNLKNQQARSSSINEVREAIENNTITSLVANLNDKQAAAPQPKR